MPSNDWLSERRVEVAAERILDAAEELFNQHGPDSVGMNEIAKAAGCSRATLYRYFENREALRAAYVTGETNRLAEWIDVDHIDDPGERLVTGIVVALRLVRESPSLSAWFASNSGALGAQLAEQSDVITGLAAAFVRALGDDHPANVAGRSRWVVRTITSPLIFPGRDAADKREMLTEFVTRAVVPVDQVSRAPR